MVRSLDEALDLYIKTFGFESPEIVTRKEMGIRSAMISLGEVTFELMQPIDDQSGIHVFLQKRGEGLHHVLLEVDDMVQERNSLEPRGIWFTEEKARYVDPSYVSFIYPKFTKGVLLELVQFFQRQQESGTPYVRPTPRVIKMLQ